MCSLCSKVSALPSMHVGVVSDELPSILVPIYYELNSSFYLECFLPYWPRVCSQLYGSKNKMFPSKSNIKSEPLWIWLWMFGSLHLTDSCQKFDVSFMSSTRTRKNLMKMILTCNGFGKSIFLRLFEWFRCKFDLSDGIFDLKMKAMNSKSNKFIGNYGFSYNFIGSLPQWMNIAIISLFNSNITFIRRIFWLYDHISWHQMRQALGL